MSASTEILITSYLELGFSVEYIVIYVFVSETGPSIKEPIPVTPRKSLCNCFEIKPPGLL